MRLRTAILCVIPGAAHVELGRALRGLLYFALFAGLANAALIGPLLGWERSVRLAAGLAAAGTWILALWDAVRLAARLRREAQEKGGEGAPFRPPETPQATAAKDIHA